MKTSKPILLDFHEYPPADMQARADTLLACLGRRRTVRAFSSRPVPAELIATCIQTANTAPSGANKQPWHFVAVGGPALKARIRAAAEAEERAFYAGKAGDEWLRDLAPLGTNADKPFLAHAPWLIAVFACQHGRKPDGSRDRHYYVRESVGIATGLLLAALHHAGLATLTHTPSPMDFLREILGRPRHEVPFLLLVTGYPAPDATVPAISRKPFPHLATILP